MKQTLMALRATGVLLAIWAILAGIAFAAGVLPPFGSEPADDTADADTDQDASGVDNGDEDTLANGDGEEDGDSEGEGEEDGDGEEEDDDAASSRPVPLTYAVCTPDTPRVTLAMLEVVGDPRPELAVGCGPRVHIYAFDDDDELPEPVLVATLDADPEGAATTPYTLSAGPLAGMDVDGDGLSDLVVPFRGITADGDTRGGSLFLLRRDLMGSFEAPVALAPIAASHVALAQMDGQPGFEILSTNRGSDLARRASEVWVFNGGAAPARASVLRAGAGDVAVAVADLDRDGRQDVLIASVGSDQMKIHFGDGTAQFPRTAEVALSGAAEVVAGDVDGDGGQDVLIRSVGLHLLAAGPPESLTPRPIEAPSTIHDITLRDLDGDRKRDVVAIDGQRIVWLRQGDELAFTEETLVEVEGAAIQRFALADVDGDSKADLVALGRAPEPGSPWSLTVVSDIREAERVVFTPVGASAPDTAPLTLRVALR